MTGFVGLRFVTGWATLSLVGCIIPYVVRTFYKYSYMGWWLSYKGLLLSFVKILCGFIVYSHQTRDVDPMLLGQHMVLVGQCSLYDVFWLKGIEYWLILQSQLVSLRHHFFCHYSCNLDQKSSFNYIFLWLLFLFCLRLGYLDIVIYHSGVNHYQENYDK